MGKLDDRVVLITGAAQGLGAAYARALAAEGAAVAVADVAPTSTTADNITQAGGRALPVFMDVRDEGSVRRGVQTVIAGLGRVDVLVCNAAVFANLAMKPCEEISVEEWDHVFAVNVRGTYLCAREVIPTMRRAKYGRIVTIASGTVFKGTPGLLHYVSSKGAIVAMTRALAREVGDDGICVNALAPGLVLSEGVVENVAMRERLTPGVLASRAIRREQVPNDLFGALFYLSSEECRFMTGQVMVVDGGSVMH